MKPRHPEKINKPSNAIKIRIGQKSFNSKKAAAEFYKIDQKNVYYKI